MSIGSYVLPSGSMPVTGMREQLSKAYLHMIASSAGLDLGDWGTDYCGFDVTMSSSVDYSPHLYAPKIDVQLKCTGQESVTKADHIAWQLETRTVDLLSRPNRSDPSLLCVLVTAADYWDWLHMDQNGLLAKSVMYWLWASDFPAHKPDQESQVVHLPSANVLNPSSILDLMAIASKWKPVTL
jgi:hypothetical protein